MKKDARFKFNGNRVIVALTKEFSLNNEAPLSSFVFSPQNLEYTYETLPHINGGMWVIDKVIYRRMNEHSFTVMEFTVKLEKGLDGQFTRIREDKGKVYHLVYQDSYLLD